MRNSSGTDKSSELNEIASLLVGATREEFSELSDQVQSIVKRIASRQSFVEQATDTLTEAVTGVADSSEFAEAMSPVIAAGVLSTARTEPKKLGDAIAPALGPAIRQSIILAMEGITERANATIHNTFSVDSIKWRIEARRTGRSFAEVAIAHSTSYQSEHVFLIDHNTGCLLHHCAAPGATDKDPAVVSSMVTAVRDFVGEAFGRPELETGSYAHQVGDVYLVTEVSGGFLLAIAVKGQPSSEIKKRLKDHVESIAVRFGSELESYNGDVDIFQAASSYLLPLLESESVEVVRPTSKGRWLIGLKVVGLALLAWMVFAAVQNYRTGIRRDSLLSSLRSEAGIVVLQGSSEDSNRLDILRDPAAEPAMAILEDHGFADLAVSETPFLSMEPQMILGRALRALSPEAGTQLEIVAPGFLKISGSASRSWIKNANNAAYRIAGVEGVDTDGLIDETKLEIEQAAADLEAQQIVFEKGSSTLGDGAAETVRAMRLRLIRLKKKLAGESADLGITVYAESGPSPAENPERDQALSSERIDQALKSFSPEIAGSFEIRVSGLITEQLQCDAPCVRLTLEEQ